MLISPEYKPYSLEDPPRNLWTYWRVPGTKPFAIPFIRPEVNSINRTGPILTILRSKPTQPPGLVTLEPLDIQLLQDRVFILNSNV